MQEAHKWVGGPSDGPMGGGAEFPKVQDARFTKNSQFFLLGTPFAPAQVIQDKQEGGGYK